MVSSLVHDSDTHADLENLHVGGEYNAEAPYDGHDGDESTRYVHLIAQECTRIAFSILSKLKASFGERCITPYNEDDFVKNITKAVIGSITSVPGWICTDIPTLKETMRKRTEELMTIELNL